MKKIVQRITLVGLFLLIAVLGAITLVPRFIPKALIERKVVEHIEEAMEGGFLYDEVQFNYFPFLSLDFKGTQLNANGGKIILQADALKLKMDLLALFFQKFEVASFEIKSGDVILDDIFGDYIDEVHIKDLDLKLQKAKKKSLKVITFEGSLGRGHHNMRGRALVHWNTFLSWNWKDAAAAGELELLGMDIFDIQRIAKFEMPVVPEGGSVSAKFSLTKKQEEGWMDIDTNLELSDFIYKLKGDDQLSSKAMDISLKSVVAWNPSTEEFQINQLNAEFPFMKVQANGHIIASTGEIQNLRISTEEVILESMPLYLIFMKQAIPTNLGFSGTSYWDITLQGTLDHLAFFANLDLEEANITYAKLFSKPKSLPMLLSFDAFLKYGKMLEGDFSVNLKGARGKGTFKEFNLLTSEGQMNFITNKFDLAAWQEILLPFKDYDLGGQVKILTNADGDFKDWEHVKKVFNLTLEDGYIAREKGNSFQHVNLALDYSEFIFSVKESSLEIGGAPVTVDFQIFNLGTNPNAKLKLSSKEINPIRVVDAVQDISLEWANPATNRFLEYSRAWMHRIFPQGRKADELRVQVVYEDGNWIFKEVNIEGYGGFVKLTGDLKEEGSNYNYLGSLFVENVHLKDFLIPKDETSSVLSGSLAGALNFKLSGLLGSDSFSNAEGFGSFEIREGEFASVDVWDSLTDITEFETFKKDKAGSTPFTRLRSNFEIANDLILLKEMKLESHDFDAVLEGEADLTGLINCRMGAYLAPEYTRVLLEKEDRDKLWQEQFGPIPFLVSGPISRPEFRVDSERLSKIKQVLGGRKTYENLESFLAVDFLEGDADVGSERTSLSKSRAAFSSAS